MQDTMHSSPSVTGDREFDALLAAVPDHLSVQFQELRRRLESEPQRVRWEAANLSMQAEAFERYGGDRDAEAAKTVKAAAKYLIARASQLS